MALAPVIFVVEASFLYPALKHLINVHCFFWTVRTFAHLDKGLKNRIILKFKFVVYFYKFDFQR